MDIFNRRKVRFLTERVRALETRNDTLQERCTKLFDENEQLRRDYNRTKQILYKERKAAQKA